MPRYLIRHPDARPTLTRSAKKDGRLVERLVYELEDGYAARAPLESTWIEARRQLAAIPRASERNQPIPNAPNIELPTGALICDSLYAQVTDTLYQATPMLTAREMDVMWEDHAKAVQRLVNWMALNEVGLRFATDNAFQDDIQLGTGILYCPWVKEEKNTTIHRIVAQEPRIIPISPDDFLVPGGSRGDHQQDEWLDIRFWYTKGEFASQARENKWDTKDSKPMAQQGRVRAHHERLANTTSSPGRELFSVENVWIYHDYENDGIDRDLLVTFDRNSKAILAVRYNPYDTRPVETMRYQVRPHLFWGLGVMEMVQPLQDAATEILNHFLLNMMLCNGRMYMARHGTVDDFTKVWPNRIVGVESTEDIKELRMSDVYPSALMGLERIIQLADRRVGVTGEFTSGNPASRVLGSRTPGITAMTAMQSVNRRFAPAFDGMRLNSAAAVRQCLWRYAERVRAKDTKVSNHLERLLGERDARLVEELLRQEDFERAVAVEFTAVSASVNREADRQNAMMVMERLNSNNQQMMQMMSMITQPGVAPIVMEAGKKILRVNNFALADFLRSFDSIRNPQRLLVDLDEELDVAKEEAAAMAQEQSLMGQIQGALGGATGGEGGGAAGENPLAALLGGLGGNGDAPVE